MSKIRFLEVIQGQIYKAYRGKNSKVIIIYLFKNKKNRAHNVCCTYQIWSKSKCNWWSYGPWKIRNFWKFALKIDFGDDFLLILKFFGKTQRSKDNCNSIEYTNFIKANKFYFTILSYLPCNIFCQIMANLYSFKNSYLENQSNKILHIFLK